ncbi:MAG TPA: GNAT family N-acetyltransferase [Solirubrobacteraceae bacterium]|nr:GNAT family N-acetyltransferase [Solirubrobacteraceae bacterium]
MPETLRTARLELEPWSEAATRLFRALATTPAVVRYIGDGRTWSDVKIQDVAVHNHEHWRRHGFGWRLARLSASGEAVGFIALSFAGAGSGVDPDAYEIGWWLAPATWGQGLGREGAVALREEAFERLTAPGILARIQPENAPSLAVARALGLTADGETSGRTGERISVLSLSEAGWRALPR